MEWIKIDNGKYKGKVLPQIILSDPDYFFRTCKAKAFNAQSRKLQKQAEYLLARSQRIRIPGNESRKFTIEYFFNPFGDFCGFEKVSRSQPKRPFSVRRNFIDFSIPFSDKRPYMAGYRTFLHNVKITLLGNNNNWSKHKSAAFFSDDANFL